MRLVIHEFEYYRPLIVFFAPFNNKPCSLLHKAFDANMTLRPRFLPMPPFEKRRHLGQILLLMNQLLTGLRIPRKHEQGMSMNLASINYSNTFDPTTHSLIPLLAEELTATCIADIIFY